MAAGRVPGTSAVLDYIEVFYNRHRLHSTNGQRKHRRLREENPGGR